jgi:hypothetical protein
VVSNLAYKPFKKMVDQPLNGDAHIVLPSPELLTDDPPKPLDKKWRNQQ